MNCRFHGWTDGIPGVTAAHPVSSSGSDSTNLQGSKQFRYYYSVLRTLYYVLCNIYEHVAMAKKANEPHLYIFYTHIHFALPSWATSRVMHRLYRCVAGQQPPFRARKK